VIYGQPVVVHESFDPEAVNRAIDAEGVTIISMVSTMVQRTLEARGDKPCPPTLRCILWGGGPAPKLLLEECARRGLPVVQTYGLTEAASQVATLSPEDALRKVGSAGKPLLPTELRIERDGVEAAVGEAGEIVVRGPTVTPGYADRPEANAGAFRDAAEIESVLRSHPAVEEAGVIGVPDERWGQAPLAFVCVREAISEAELKTFCASRLARYKVPTQIRFIEALPRNASGKLLRRELSELWVASPVRSGPPRTPP
jgi:O-succinylbenzoic acid--CoA ligase